MKRSKTGSQKLKESPIMPPKLGDLITCPTLNAEEPGAGADFRNSKTGGVRRVGLVSWYILSAE
ncbi:hypothetical protein N8612_00525 [Verrucomicrobia bacterium]|nr:hypothetical protein [Verrucomicrobiota bacterium]